MLRGIEMKPGVAERVMLVALMAVIGFVLACSLPATIKAPVDEVISYKGFTIPEKKPAGSVPLTVAIVNPAYASNLPDELRQSQTLQQSLKAYSKFLGTSLDEIIIAKGMAAKGPFASLEDMTYPDKKATDLLLTAQVYLLPQDTKTLETNKFGVELPDGSYNPAVVSTIEMSVELWVAYELRELSCSLLS